MDICEGPNELSIVNKEFIPLVLGASGLPKGSRKFRSFSYRSTLTIIVWEGRLPYCPPDKLNLPLLIPFPSQTHTLLRKSWGKAFTSVLVMNEYAPVLISNVSKLTGHLRRLCETEGDAHVDFAEWMTFFSWV
jgi:hypothetical protein